MKKVLIVSFYFPPCINIGAQRPYRLAKYLSHYGWEPIILTKKLPGKPPNGIRIIETEYKDIIRSVKSIFGFDSQKGIHEQIHIQESKNYDYSLWKSKIIKFLREAIAFPDDFIGWHKFAIKSACDLLDKEHIDAIISTSYPVTSHLIASKLKKKYHVPWVADFRDLWTQNHYVRKYRMIHFAERLLEVKTLSDADLLVTVHPLTDVLKELHKGRNAVCITNGYDPDDYPDTPVKLTEKFTITYTGILYAGKRDPSMLFRVTEQLIHAHRIDRDRLEINFIGCTEQWLTEEVKRHGLEKVVRIQGIIPREEALRFQRKSQVLLILRWKNIHEEHIYPGKLFEYFGAKRPILAIGAGGVVKNILETTHTGMFADNENTLRDILLQYYSEFVDTGAVRYTGNQCAGIYAYPSIARQYASVLDELTCQ